MSAFYHFQRMLDEGVKVTALINVDISILKRHRL